MDRIERIVRLATVIEVINQEGEVEYKYLRTDRKSELFIKNIMPAGAGNEVLSEDKVLSEVLAHDKNGKLVKGYILLDIE